MVHTMIGSTTDVTIADMNGIMIEGRNVDMSDAMTDGRRVSMTDVTISAIKNDITVDTIMTNAIGTSVPGRLRLWGA